ncbi:hypothetical protein ILUMI_09526 [Ignelater luminosus]|uniref:Uncharacterized protein n=1 Tax=Ignelater luminosus TaxID=2038154 RepID=A0A8K0CZU0_IGNLU|nr:hypothetical protein ILUMI_09526 [Ignelater luminosus]
MANKIPRFECHRERMEYYDKQWKDELKDKGLIRTREALYGHASRLNADVRIHLSITVSSAIVMCDDIGKSDVNKMYSNGPMILPWDTPELICDMLETLHLTLVFCVIALYARP